MTRPDPALLQGVVAQRVLDALSKASAALMRAGVRHVVAGGLAVGANGHPRATADIDFLVGDEAFEHLEGGLVTLRAGVPYEVDGLRVRLRSVQPGEDHLAAALEAPPGSMLDAPPLVYLKLKSRRMKDRTDVVEMIKGGLDVEACRRYLELHAPHLLGALEEATRQAAAEDE